MSITLGTAFGSRVRSSIFPMRPDVYDVSLLRTLATVQGRTGDKVPVGGTDDMVEINIEKKGH
jgi:hypothetical protein